MNGRICKAEDKSGPGEGINSVAKARDKPDRENRGGNVRNEWNHVKESRVSRKLKINETERIEVKKFGNKWYHEKESTRLQELGINGTTKRDQAAKAANKLRPRGRIDSWLQKLGINRYCEEQSTRLQEMNGTSRKNRPAKVGNNWEQEDRIDPVAKDEK